MDATTLERAVDSLWRATREGRYCPEEWKGKLSHRDAYLVQLGMLARHVAAGDIHLGWKVGLTAKAIQAQFGVYEPVFGFLLGSGAKPSGAVLAFADLIQPGVENELCLTLGTALQGPGVTLPQARAAIAATAPALEVVENRGDVKADLSLTLADNVQQRAFVTGRPITVAPEVDLSRTTVDVFINDVSRERASGAQVMGDPAASVAWLANKLAEFGWRLAAGVQIMSGSFTRQYPVNRGDRIESRFVPFGTVAAEFR